jgi:hypothetical protein
MAEVMVELVEARADKTPEVEAVAPAVTQVMVAPAVQAVITEQLDQEAAVVVVQAMMYFLIQVVQKAPVEVV